MFDLTGKVAIVTGGAGGLGRPISIGLAKAGADVVVDDLEKADPQAVVEEIEKQGETVKRLKQLGQCYYNEGQWAESAEAFERLLELDPGNVIAQAYLKNLQPYLDK